MKWRRAAVLPLIFALSACAEGGGRGTGIFATVAGNVVSAQTAGLPGRAFTPSTGAPGLRAAVREFLHIGIEDAVSAQSDVEGIEVTIENTNIRAETDTDGNFTLRGSFEGDITVIFEIPDGGGMARIALNVPAAGTLTLNNVRLDTQQGEASAETQAVDFEAIITAIDCPGQILTLVSSQESGNDMDQYKLRLDTSTVQDANGNPVPCTGLQVGEQAAVQGFVNPDGTFGDATVVLQD